MENQRTIRLYSGGSVTLTGDFNALDLCTEDKEFIDSLLESMYRHEADVEEYEKREAAEKKG